MAAQELDDHRLRRLIAVGRSFVSELDPESLLDEILVAAQELTGARYAALGILDERRELLSRFLTRGVDDATHRAIGDLPHGRGILGVLINEPEPLRLDDLQSHPRSFGFPVGHPPMTSFLGVPIVVRGAAWGNIYLTEKEGGEPFDAADEEALVILADWAAVAVENSNLYARLRGRHDELERVNQGLAATTAIARAIGAETQLGRVLELIVKRGRALVEARTMVISLPEGDDLVVAAAAGESDGAAPGNRLPTADSTQGAVLRDGRPRRITAEGLERDPSTFGVEDVGSALLVPLVFRGRSLGVLSAFDRIGSDDGFTAKDEELLRAFAASAATAVATAQTVGEQRLRDALDSAEQERRRWARELHDETLQGLAGLQVRLSTALRQGTDTDLETAVGEVLDQVGLEIRKLRTLITELRPAALDELGLEPALESLARDVAATTGLQIDVGIELPQADGERPLGPESETTVYRLVQEALTNVVKHAGAARVIVEVRPEEGHLLVEVRDDGRGVDPSRLRAREGFGVTGMRERARLAGGAPARRCRARRAAAARRRSAPWP
ncbi:GAF domain-containing protein, partial [Patulibacter sp. S7RM1-6]